MKKRVYAILIALLLSTVTLAGCGDSGSSRRDRDRYEEDEDDNKDRSSRKDRDEDDNDGTSKEAYLKDVRAIVEAAENMENLSSDPNDGVKELKAIVNSLKVKTPEGKAVKADLEKMSKAMDKLAENEDDEDAFDDLMEAMGDFTSDLQELVEAAEEAGVDEDDLADLF